MTDLRTAAQQALEVLEVLAENAEDECGEKTCPDCQAWRPVWAAINALKAVLEQPEQEPVAWMMVNKAHNLGPSLYWKPQTDWHITWDAVPLFTHPPRREWRGLKEWEINDGREQLPTEDLCNWSFRKGVEFAEAALKEKNL